MAKQSKQSKKAGRNKYDALAYKNESRREKNKLARLEKHLKKTPDDATAIAAKAACIKIIRGY